MIPAIPTYVLGIIDSHGAVHSVAVEHPAQIHEDFWPTAYKRWRYSFMENKLMNLDDVVEDEDRQLSVEETDHVYQHLIRKGYH